MVEAPGFPPFTSFSWDETKRESNIAKHGVDFASVEFFDFPGSLVAIDDRQDYGEIREIAVGFVEGRLHVLVYTRRQPALHLISLRKANDREIKYYEGAT